MFFTNLSSVLGPNNLSELRAFRPAAGSPVNIKNRFKNRFDLLSRVGRGLDRKDRTKIWYIMHTWKTKEVQTSSNRIISHVFFYRYCDRVYHFPLMCFPGDCNAPEDLLPYVFVKLELILWVLSFLQHFFLFCLP